MQEGEQPKPPKKSHAPKFRSAKLMKQRKECKHQNVKKDGLSSQKVPKQKFRCKDCGKVWTKPVAKKAKTRPAPIKVPIKKGKRNQKAKR